MPLVLRLSFAHFFFTKNQSLIFFFFLYILLSPSFYLSLSFHFFLPTTFVVYFDQQTATVPIFFAIFHHFPLFQHQNYAKAVWKCVKKTSWKHLFTPNCWFSTIIYTWCGNSVMASRRIGWWVLCGHLYIRCDYLEEKSNVESIHF